MYRKVIKRLSGIILSLLFLGAMVGAADAVTTFNMTAGTTTLTMPDGVPVPMWGFALDSTDVDGTVTPGDGLVKVPGDPLVVPPGETTVTINLTNNLPEPVSLNILGQVLTPAGGPVWTELDGTVVANPRSVGNYTARVRSFAHETPAGGGPISYTWTNFKPGTYLLRTGTNPAKQVQMGLYAAITMDAAPGLAYPDNLSTAFDESVPYDKELILVYSEVDPVMNIAIDSGTYGPGGTITSSLHRDPKYFLVNGKAFNPALPDGGGLDPVNAGNPIYPGSTVLVRLLNAGYDTHVPQLLNMYMGLVAEDGNPYKYAPRQQYGVQMPAGKTVDAILALTAIGRFPLYDAMLNQTNAGTSADGGMLAFLDIEVSCFATSDIQAPGGDGDVDGLDLQAFSGLTPAEIAADIAVFAGEFGQICP